LHSGEEDCITEAVNLSALLAALEYPDQHGASGKDHQRQYERNDETGGEPTMAFLPGKKSCQFLAYHRPSALPGGSDRPSGPASMTR
jgi:hypothetical protein